MNVKTAFLNGELDEEIYMKQLIGFIVEGQGIKFANFIAQFMALSNRLDSGIFVFIVL